MKKLLFLAGAFLLPALTTWAQTYSVSASSSTYSSAGGNVTLTASLAYPANVTGVSLGAKPPGGTWKFVSASPAEGSEPLVRPTANDVTDPADPGSEFGFSYRDVIANSASFSFVLNYPAGLSGNQTITFRGHYNLDGTHDVTVASVVLTPTPEAPTIVTQPASVSVTAGQNAPFSVVASGVPAPTFQWRRSTDGGANFADISNDSTFSGATTANLTVTAVTLAMTSR